MPVKHRTPSLEREDFGTVTIVRLKMPKAVDEDSIRDDFAMIYTLVDNIGRRQLVLNLAAVEYFPSMGLGKLIMLNRKLQAVGGRLALCQLSLAVAEALRATHIDHLFAIFDTEPEAVQFFAAEHPVEAPG